MFQQYLHYYFIIIEIKDTFKNVVKGNMSSKNVKV